MKKYILSFTLVFIVGGLFAQNTDWVDMMNDPNANFYTIKQNFDEYWKEREIERGKGYKQFVRWAEFWEPRVTPEGNFPDRGILMQEFLNMQQTTQVANPGQWVPLGPYDGSTIDPSSIGVGIGRINRVVFHPTNNQIVFACAPAGGLWKSTDGGVTWETNTDLLPNLGASDLAINPLNPNVMYLATGDRNAGDTYSYGILKTTDGGVTWKPTGLSFGVSFTLRAMNVYVSPADTSLVLAATRAGIYRSTDAGATFTRVESSSFNNMVQKPGNPNVLYSTTFQGSNCVIYRSFDAGQTWNVIADPVLPISNSRRIELAVTPDDSNYVYAVIGNNNYGLEGVYRSTDGGDNWTMVYNGPNNLLGSSPGSSGGQAWYDLTIAANPTNKNEVVVGGINVWRSTNAGSSWTMIGSGYSWNNKPFLHADIHHLAYQPVTNHLYAGTDGGVYRRKLNQVQWDELNDGMNITQYYRLSGNARDTNKIIAGAQDNAVHIYDNGQWNAWSILGDGMDNALNPKNADIMYGGTQYGRFWKSTDANGSWSSLNNNGIPSGNGGWVTPLVLDPEYPDTLYVGYDRLYKSFDGGSSFTTASPFGYFGGVLDQLAIAPSQTSIIYASRGANFFKTNNRGNTWADLSSNAPSGQSITKIAVDPVDHNHVIITKSGYSTSNKVFESLDGGVSWTSIANGLPNLPANCVVIQDNPERSIYVGMDVGVFYRDSINPTWVEFNGGLPNVIVNDLDINYTNRQLRAATYGRGVWQSPLYSDLVPPNAKAEFPTAVCVGDTVQLLNMSEYSPEDFQWYIEPATYSFVSTSGDTLANPMIVFNQPGYYNVSLVASNAIGSDSAFFVGAIVAGGLPLPYYNDLDQAEDFSRWTYEDSAPGWEAVNSSKGMSFRASLFNNASVGARYELTSPAINLTAHDSVELSFEYAYSGLPANSGDSLLVYASGNCSENWILIAALGEDGSNNFVTATGTSTAFDPSASEWCGGGLAGCAELSLQAFSGQEGVRIRFVAVNANGNHLYLDNISVTGKSSVAPSAGFYAPTQVCAMDSVSFYDQTFGSPDVYEWTFSGPVTLSSNDRNPRMIFSQAGQYDVKLKVSNINGSDSLTQSAYLLVDPADSVNLILTAATDSICAGDDLNFALSGVNTGSTPVITWYVNGQVVSIGNDYTADLENLANGDQVFVSLESSLSCAYPDVAVSDTVTVYTYPVITPQVNTPNIMCITDPALNLSGVPAGGVFTGNGVVNGNTFDPAVAGTGSSAITYTVSDGNGCSYSTVKYIGVTKPVTLNITRNETSCENGDAISLNVGQPAGGQYSGPGVYNNFFIPDSVSGPGTYKLTYSYFSSVCGTSSKDFDMTVYAEPDAPGIIVHNTYLECDTIASGYQWYDTTGAINGATAKTFSPSVDGQYRVEISSNRGCTSLSAASGFYIGLSDLPAGFSFNLYPNPARDQLNLDLEVISAHDLMLNLYDQVGNLILTRELMVSGSLKESLDVSKLAAGVYLFTLDGEEVNIRRKVIIE